MKTDEELAKELLSIEMKYCDDTEMVHIYADEFLCGLLRELGYTKLVEVYDDIGKWYA